MTPQTLERLLEQAREANGQRRIEFRDPIAAFGSVAVPPMRAWLEDENLGAFAVVVLERTGRTGEAAERQLATKALVDGRESADPRIVHLVDAALARLGWKARQPHRSPAPMPELPREARVAPAWEEAHHVVVTHLEDSPTEWGDLYLFECGRWFSGGWVREHGELLDPAGRPICEQCRAAITQSRQHPLGRTPEPMPDRHERAYVLGNIWHIISGDLVPAPRVGAVYLTECYRWYEASGRDVSRGRLPAGEQLCQSCEKNLEAHRLGHEAHGAL